MPFERILPVPSRLTLLGSAGMFVVNAGTAASNPAARPDAKGNVLQSYNLHGT